MNDCLTEFRNNPITAKFYPNWRLSDVTGDLVVDRAWKEMDFGFQLRTTDRNFSRRRTYRALLSGTLSKLSLLDGIEVSLVERENGHFLLQNLRNSKKRNDDSLAHGSLSEALSSFRDTDISFSTGYQQVGGNSSLKFLDRF